MYLAGSIKKKKEPGIRENLTPIAARLGNKRENPLVVLFVMSSGINSVRSAIASCGRDPTMKVQL